MRNEFIAHRMKDITSFMVMDILERAIALEADGVDVVHMEVGEPDFDPPAAVVEAAANAARSGHTHYTHSLGVWELREAIAAMYEREYGVSVSPERIIITPGTSGAFMNAFASTLDAGDKIALTDPGYPCYPNFARVINATPIFIPVDAEDGFKIRKERVEEAIEQGAKVVVAASPANPTGSIVPAEVLEHMANSDALLISDEIYHGLVYSEARVHTALEFSNDVIVINGFSKRFAMTGLRIGWAVVPDALVREFQKLNQNLYICPDSISQQAAIAALTDPSCKEDTEYMRQTYAKRRRLLIDGLRDIGFVIHHEPEGAFYVFADISKFAKDGFEFAWRMLEEAHVAATPGVDFGRHETGHFMRFAYTTSSQRIEEGLIRMKKWLAS